jgi:hypothetical protein
MAASLIGISVAVTLQHPPNTVVQGTVAAVNAQTATLTLRDGTTAGRKCSKDSKANLLDSVFSRDATPLGFVQCRRARDR